MKIALLVFLVSLFFFLPETKLFASSETAYKDYLYQFDQYRTKLNNFKVARTEYLKYKTLLAETTALDTVKTMLTQRNQLLRSYLLLLNEKLNENKGLSASDRQHYQAKIQEELVFLETNSGLVSPIGLLSAATEVSKNLETHYLTLEITIRQTIIALALGDLFNLDTQYTSSFTTLKDLTKTNAPTVSPQKQATIDRWVVQIQNKQDLFKQKSEAITTANGQISGRTDQEIDAKFVAVQKNLAEAKQYLQEGSSYMQELVQLLRYQD